MFLSVALQISALIAFTSSVANASEARVSCQMNFPTGYHANFNVTEDSPGSFTVHLEQRSSDNPSGSGATQSEMQCQFSVSNGVLMYCSKDVAAPGALKFLAVKHIREESASGVENYYTVGASTETDSIPELDISWTDFDARDQCNWMAYPD